MQVDQELKLKKEQHKAIEKLKEKARAAAKGAALADSINDHVKDRDMLSENIKVNFMTESIFFLFISLPLFFKDGSMFNDINTYP